MMRARTLAAGFVLLAALALPFAAPGEARADYSGTTAADCYHDGYKSLFRADATAFSNVGECVAYGIHNDDEFGIGPHINVWAKLFSPDDNICYGIGDETCRGVEVTGQGLQPLSTVTVSVSSAWTGPRTFYEPVDENGNFWMEMRFACEASGSVTATGTSWSGDPLLGYSEFFPFCL